MEPNTYIGKKRETHKLILSWLSWLVSSVGRGHVHMKMTRTESYKMAAILQLIGRQRHALLVYRYFFGIGYPCYGQLTEHGQNKVPADQFETILEAQV